jgi:PKHD-type hydroxylase
VNLQYNYWYFKSAISELVCDRIIEMGLTSMHEQKLKFGEEVLAGNTGGWKQKQEGLSPLTTDDTIDALSAKGVNVENSYIRDTKITFLSNPELYELIWPFIKDANTQANWNFEWDYTEDMQFAKYETGHFYGWHSDSSDRPYKKFDPAVDAIHRHANGTPYLNQFGDPIPEDHNITENPNMTGKIRKISVTVSLSDPAEYDGGNLQFDLGPHRSDRYHTCTEIRPKGSVIVFPSHVTHQVTPVTRGTRYSLVCWSLGAPFK